MVDIVPQRIALVEQPKKARRRKKKITQKLSQKGRAWWARKESRRALKRQERKARRAGRAKKRREQKALSQARGVFSFSKLVFAAAVLVIVAAAVFVVLTLKSKLTLSLYFAQQNIAIEDEVKVDVDQTEPDLENKVIPGKFFEEEKEKWEVFAATGKVAADRKAGGVIKVYNSHNPPRPVTLVSQSRFLSSGGGKIFRALEKIYLPSASIKGGKIVPSVTEIKVEAQEAGADYNIEPSKFSVPGLAGTALYYTVWAESEKPMEGGSEEEVTKVTEDDLENAKQELALILRNSAQNSLKRKVSEGFVLDDSAIVEEDIETTCFNAAETVALDFNCYGKIKLKGLAFKAEDLKNIAFGFIKAVKPSSKELREESLEVSSVLKGVVTKAGKMVLSVSAAAKAYEQLNQDLLFYQIYGKKAEDIRKVILDNFPQIEKVQLSFWPFWVRRAPKNIERINIRLTPFQP